MSDFGYLPWRSPRLAAHAAGRGYILTTQASWPVGLGFLLLHSFGLLFLFGLVLLLLGSLSLN